MLKLYTQIALCTCIIGSTHAAYHTIQLHTPASTTMSPIRCYYKGERFDITDHWALIPENKEVYFTLVITEHIEPVPATRGNTITHFKRDAHVKCSWFEVSKKYDDTTGAGWHITQKEESDMPERLPHDALIIHINPSCLDAITVNQFTNTLQLNLAIKSDYTQTQIDDIVMWSLAASLDTETFHRRLIFSEKKEYGKIGRAHV